jgi:chromatin segregation and condensation protein Rec8/ScpA/Scc1 (kleisin family)
MRELSTELCPACGLRPQEDPEAGFCIPCAERRALERYLERRTAEASARNEEWRRRTATPEHLRERQHYSRLLRVTRPRERAWSTADPLELGHEALRHLARLRPSPTSSTYDDWAAACELVRRLAWGPG